MDISIAWCVSVEPQPLVFADIHREQRIWELPSSWNCRVWLREGGREGGGSFIYKLMGECASKFRTPTIPPWINFSGHVFVGNHFNLAPWFWNIAKVDSRAWPMWGLDRFYLLREKSSCSASLVAHPHSSRYESWWTGMGRFVDKFGRVQSLISQVA